MSIELTYVSGMNIFQLEQTLVDLMTLREEAETDEERKVIDGEIEKYVAQEIRKVDNIRGYLRHCGLMQSAAKQEAARLTAVADTWRNRAERLKEICKAAMEMFKAKRIEGKTGALLLKGNGGLEPLVITNDSLVPDDCCMYEGRISGAAWDDLSVLIESGRTYLMPDGQSASAWWKSRQDVQMVRTPNPGLIRSALRNGPVAGCYLGERGSHVEVK